MVTQLKIHWPVALFITAVLYILTIVCLPFNQTYSTLFMFAIISFWSRLPGVGIPSPMLFLYFMDVIDFFSVIISHALVFDIIKYYNSINIFDIQIFRKIDI